MMVFGSKTDYETMLQIVPSAGFSPPSSSEYSSNYVTDNFDLSLLPAGMDTEMPFSTTTNNVQQFLSLYYDMNSPPPLFPVYDNTTKESTVDHFVKETTNVYEETFTKESIFLDKCNNNTWNLKDSSDFLLNKQFRDKDDMNKHTFLDMEMADWENKNDWDNMRVQSSVSSTHSVTSSSNCSSPAFQLCPSTPPDFENLIPLDDIKQEITLNLQNLLTEDKIEKPVLSCGEQKKPELLRSILEKSPLNEAKTIDRSKSNLTDNHKLLREVLKDTSFQKKYNLRPIDIEGLGTGFQSEIKNEDGTKNTLKEDVCDVNLAEGIIAPMLSKAIEQLMQDVDNTCIMLGIPRDPKKWSVEDVRSWLVWNSRQYNLPILMELFNVSGVTLTSMNEHDFQQRAPQCGNILYAQLEIWKVNSMEDTHLDVNNLLCDTNTQTNSSIEVSDEDEDEDEVMTDTSSNCSPSIPSPSIKMAGRGSGSHIHLWQFLKELLASPQAHGSCIRWLDRNKGVFKIEDSVRVARLWGKRKNRPAMNYDKLSRSIRQYYKKGIMKKTERSQRLVYQFCTPYNL